MSDPVRTLLQRAGALARQGRAGEAFDALEEGLRDTPGQPDLRYSGSTTLRASWSGSHDAESGISRCSYEIRSACPADPAELSLTAAPTSNTITSSSCWT